MRLSNYFVNFILIYGTKEKKMTTVSKFPNNIDDLIAFIKENKDNVTDIRGDGLFVDTDKFRLAFPGTLTLSITFQFLKLKESK